MSPGTAVTIGESSPPRSAPTNTGIWFVTGLTDRGPADAAGTVRNIAEFEKKYGIRQSYSVLYDALDVFFREGGSEAKIARVVGPAPVKALRTLVDRAGAPLNTLRVDAESAGAWGNNLTVEVINGVTANTFILIIRESGVEVERSPELASPAAAVDWSVVSVNVNVVNLASATVAPNNNPAVVAASAFTTGNDDRVNAVDAQWLAALNLFGRSLGPGQVSMPGRTTTTAHTDLLAHAQSRNRVALLDATDTVSDATLSAAAVAIRAATIHERHGGFFAPWTKAPGILGGSARDIPPSALSAGLMSRSDAANSPNVPAAGDNGQARYVTTAKAAFTDTQREALNMAGVNISREMYGGLRLYGFRTLVDPVLVPSWRSLASARLFMKIISEGEAIAEGFVFDEIDGRGRKIAEYESMLTGMLLGFYNVGSLYGETPEEAFRVETGSMVNTPVTIADGQLKAVISVKASPFAEMVVLEIIKVNNTEVL